MRKIAGLIFALGLFISSNIYAAKLSEDEESLLMNEVASITSEFESGDTTNLIAKTHSSLVSVMGGMENFKKAMESAVELIDQQGLEFIDAEVGLPTQLYEAGSEEVAFVPRISTMVFQGQKIKSTGFMIAIRTKGLRDWSYLDGSGMRGNQSLLWELLPRLDKQVKLPPNTLSPVE